MEEAFNQEAVDEYMHLVLDATLASDKFFIIMGREASPFEAGDPTVFMIEGHHPEDVLGIISETINEVPQ